MSVRRERNIRSGSRRWWALVGIAAVASLLLATIPAGAQESGSVEATVTVEGPCLTVSEATVDFGVGGFSNHGENTVLSAGPITVTNCTSQVQVVMASVSDAVGNVSAGWTLDQWDESALACDWGIDTFGAGLEYLVAGGIVFWMPAGAANLQISTQAPGDSNDYGPRLLMPCTSSSGVGETMTFGYTLTGVLP